MRKRKNEEVQFTDEDGMRELKKGFPKAEELLKNREKMDQVLKKKKSFFVVEKLEKESKT